MSNKKPNPEKGMRTVTIDFAGKTRTLKWGHTINGDFEIAANQVLRSIGVVKEGMVFAEGLMQNWLGNSRILTLALWHALKHEDAELTMDAVDEGIDAFLQDGKSKIELVRSVITTYQCATNPSSVASLMRSWKISDDREKIEEAAKTEQMDQIEKALADVKVSRTGGSTSNDLPKSNSDSDQTKSES